MAARLPTQILRQLYRKRVAQSSTVRSFSTTLPAAARPVDHHSDYVRVASHIRHARGTTMHQMRAEQMRDQKTVEQDLGIITGSFIRAPVSKLLSSYSWTKFASWKTIAWYYGKFITSNIKAWASLIQIWWKYRELPSLHVLPWHRRDVKEKALAKYKQLYQSFARGDKKTINDICLDKVAAQFRDRIAARSPGLLLQWKATKPSVRMVSNRMMLLSDDGDNSMGIQQIVFRIQSAQSLQRSGEEKPVESSKVVEYFVLQRSLAGAKFTDWTIWGFTNEWTPETIVEDEDYEQKMLQWQSSQGAQST